jgi:hypothetical protein
VGYPKTKCAGLCSVLHCTSLLLLLYYYYYFYYYYYYWAHGKAYWLIFPGRLTIQYCGNINFPDGCPFRFDGD